MKFFADSYELSDTEITYAANINEKMNSYVKNSNSDEEHENLINTVKLSFDYLLGNIERDKYEGRISNELQNDLKSFFFNEFWSSLNSFRDPIYCQQFILKMRFALQNVVESNIES